MPDSQPSLDALVEKVAERPDAMMALARHMDRARALDLVTRALELAPDDAALRALGRRIISAPVPGWHFVIVRDAVRNTAYEEALKRAVTRDSKVLEVGAGSGLLALMAARAGAREVITCEADPAIAAAAKEAIAHNGYSDRIRVVAKHSSALDVAADLGGPADVLVSEIVSNDLLGESVLPVMQDVVPRLLKPGAAVIPARGCVRVALAHDAKWAGGRMGTVAGFDLSAFNRFAPPRREIGVADTRLTLRSEPADLFRFDFASGGPYAAEAARIALQSAGGVVSGVVQWLALDLDEMAVYENRPGAGSGSCWAAVFHAFERPMDTLPGEIIDVGVHHDQHSVWVWAEMRPPPHHTR